MGLGLALSVGLEGGSSLPAPLTVSGLVAWYRSDSLVTRDGSNNVSSWGDLSGNGNTATQGNSVRRLAYIANAYNGQPALRGNADRGRWLQTSYSLATGASTVFYVFSPSSLVNTYLFSGISTTTQYSLIENFSVAKLEWFANSGTDRHTIANSLSAGLHYVCLAQTDTGGSANETAYLDGTQVYSVTPSGVSEPLLYIMGTPSGSGSDGDVVEAIQYNRQLSSTEIALINAYIKGRYAL